MPLYDIEDSVSLQTH